ncbi:copper-transporting P-type ATPase [Nemania sp. FL0916]|nr:copper-transporting P-type ATPase [Nemania sp. FL0916]
MGADCCGNKKTAPPSPSPRSSRDSHEGSSEGSSAAESSKSPECCTAENERCNEQCLKSVAMTLCAEGVGAHSEGRDTCGTGGCNDGCGTSACDAHIQMAFAQYQSFLDNVRCICRSMIERGFKSCCQASAVDLTAPNGCGTAKEDCCSSSAKPTTNIPLACCSGDKPENQKRQCTVPTTGKENPNRCCGDIDISGDRQSDLELLDNCCGGVKRIEVCCDLKTGSMDVCVDQSPNECCSTRREPTDDCCSKNKIDDCGTKNKSPECSIEGGFPAECHDESCCGQAQGILDPCCDIEKQCSVTHPRIKSVSDTTGIEKGDRVRARIHVSGMTCNGCSENLARSLETNGAHDIRVNYLQSYADFTVDPDFEMPTLVRKVQGATGFQISIIGTNESITILTPCSRASMALAEKNFDGVEKVEILNKKTVRIQYNPAIIGARDLFQKIGCLSVGLAPPQNDQQLASGRKLFSILFAQTTAAFVFTIPVLVLAWGNTRVKECHKAVISLVLGTLVQFLAIPVFYKPALKSLVLHRQLELDMLVVIAITAAYVYSVVAFAYLMVGAALETPAFFETSSLLISLIMLGRLAASYARIRAVAAVSVRSLQVATATIVENTVDHEIDARLLQFGDVFKVAPYSRVPTDGIILSGASEIDESMVTGESLPVIKIPGSSVIAGTMNGPYVLLVKLTRLPGKNTITDIAKLVEDASTSKPRVQEIADRVAGWFLPTVLSAATVVFIIWIIIGIKVRNQTGGESVATAITYAVAVLAVSCPCGLGLAAPLVLVVANGIAARGGVIVKSAQCMERSRKVTDVIFDKTGTLTEPELDVAVEETYNDDAADARAITKALIKDSQHPVSVAVARHLGPNTKPAPSVTDVKSIPGAGVEGTMSGLVVRAGHAAWTDTQEVPKVRKLLDDGMTTLLVTQDSTLIASYGLRTRLRADAVATVAKLRENGINVHLVSGDQNKAVQAIAGIAGIDRANVASERNPKEKQEYVAALMAQPGKIVMFVGDGTNDAVAVAQADIGVQISDTLVSSDVTRSAADIVLLSGLSGIPFLIDVSRAAFARIAFNIVWSGVYNVFAILLAAGAFVRARIAPAYAGAGELVSILPIVVVSLTMLLLKLRRD